MGLWKTALFFSCFALCACLAEPRHVEWGVSIVQTQDNGFVVVGKTTQNDIGGHNALVLKLDAFGQIQWGKTLGGIFNETAYSVIETPDSSLLLSAQTSSFGAGNEDMWIIKLDKNGHIIWQKSLGGKETDWAHSIVSTTDGGFVVAGHTSSFGGALMWIVKFNANNEIVWQKTLGNPPNTEYSASAIIETKDNGLVVVGKTSLKMFVAKLDADGNPIWQKLVGSSLGWDTASSVSETPDGGIVVLGITTAGEGESWNMLVLKFDRDGNLIWEKTIGNSRNTWAGAIMINQDGRIVLTGSTQPSNLDWTHVGIVLELDENGVLVTQNAAGGQYVDRPFAIVQIKEGNYVFTGYTASFGENPGTEKMWIVQSKVDGTLPTVCKTTAQIQVSDVTRDVGNASSTEIKQSNAVLNDTKAAALPFTAAPIIHWGD
ncbi:MAG: hypothetical protein V1754_03705 [Pseudomonadota bacterium]